MVEFRVPSSFRVRGAEISDENGLFLGQIELCALPVVLPVVDVVAGGLVHCLRHSLGDLPFRREFVLEASLADFGVGERLSRIAFLSVPRRRSPIALLEIVGPPIFRPLVVELLSGSLALVGGRCRVFHYDEFERRG